MNESIIYKLYSEVSQRFCGLFWSECAVIFGNRRLRLRERERERVEIFEKSYISDSLILIRRSFIYCDSDHQFSFIERDSKNRDVKRFFSNEIERRGDIQKSSILLQKIFISYHNYST